MIEEYLKKNNLAYSIDEFKSKGGNKELNSWRKKCYKYLYQLGWTMQVIATEFGRDKSTIWSSIKK